MRETRDGNDGDDEDGCITVIMWAVIIVGGLMISGLAGWIMTIYSAVVNYNALLK